jgi:putative tryptophan/tyrosine transport system substrate-binding protein
MMHGPEKSDPVIVAGKPTNKAERSAAELVEPRAGTKGNADRQSTHWTQSQARVSHAFERIRQAVAVTHPRWEPHAGKPHVRICAGGARQLASLPLRRRAFIAGVGSAVAWPLVARGQQPAMPVIGFLNGQSAQTFAPAVAAFRRGLNEAGYVEGQNVAIEYRWAEGQLDRLPPLAADLVRHQVAVIAATGGNNSAHVAMQATSTIPIVFTSSDNAVERGLVASINRPSGNVTGVSWFNAELGPKRLGLLHELVPKATIVALLVNPNNPESVRQPSELQHAARAIGLQLVVLTATSAGDIDAAFTTMVQNRVGGLLIGSDPFFTNRREQIIGLAAQHAIPTIYLGREIVEAGGLMSYGNSLPDVYRRAGIQTARILKGAKPSELPVDQETKFELVINLKTAKTLGLEIPPDLLARADEVIE